MDPNVSLQTIRGAYTALLALMDSDCLDAHDAAEIVAELASGTQDLDAWLCRGGYAPAAWAGTAR